MGETLSRLILIAWVPAVFLIFSITKPRKAVFVSFIFAWLYLPMAGINLPSMPDVTKVSVTNLAVILCIAIFDPDRILRFRFHWLDIPIIVLCLVPIPSFVVNGMGIYPGLADTLDQFLLLGVAYFIGRLYITDIEAAKELLLIIFIGACTYAPFILYENRFSPTLHATIYGFQVAGFDHAARWGGWRPTVFMQSGIAVAVWTCLATFAGIILYFTGRRKLFGIPFMYLIVGMLFVSLLCRTMSGLALLLFGLIALFGLRFARTKMVLLALFLLPGIYIGLRGTNMWSGQQPVWFVATFVSVERSKSLSFRIKNETLFIDHTMRSRPMLGWAGHGRNFPRNENGKALAPVDQFWIIVVSCFGLIGLVSFILMFAMPTVWMWMNFDREVMTSKVFLPAVGMALIFALYMVDNLFNAFVNPIWMLCGGGTASITLAAIAARKREKRRRRVMLAQQRFAIRPVGT